MKIFISWSGERSQSLAQALRDWLPMVLHYAEPWLSHSDIEAGDRWANVVAKELETTKFGIICITRDNIASPWILFESGALAKSMQEGRVIPLLLDIEFKDIAGPLAQFQAKKVERAGIHDVVTAINQLSDAKLTEARLTMQFDTLWPTLEAKVTDIPKSSAPARQNRPQHEILEELVSSVRGIDMRFRESAEENPRWRRRRHRFHPMMIDEMMHMMEFGPRDPTRLLVLASMLREDFPWIYELGAEAYRLASDGKTARAREAHRRFFAACKMLRRGPFMDMADDKETHMYLRELAHLVEREISHLPPEESEEAPVRKRKRSPSNDAG
jgi:hypothetical protein